jgi:hypothetical protein
VHEIANQLELLVAQRLERIGRLARLSDLDLHRRFLGNLLVGILFLLLTRGIASESEKQEAMEIEQRTKENTPDLLDLADFLLQGIQSTLLLIRLEFGCTRNEKMALVSEF